MEGKWIRKTGSNSVLVFIHGILSNSEGAWKSSNGAYWPNLVKDEPDLTSLGIFTFSYHTGVFSGGYSVNDSASALHQVLSANGVLEAERIIFCCHSMGGIVARKFLVDYQQEWITKRKRIGLLLVGSPSLGSRWANLMESYVLRIPRFLSILKHKQLDNIRHISNNDYLFDLNNRFRKLLDEEKLFIVGRELLEDRLHNFTNLKLLIVSKSSASAFFADPLKIPRSTHSSICKPENRSALQHIVLIDLIGQLLNKDEVEKPKTRHLNLDNAFLNNKFQFNYRSKITEFIGREKELEQLNSFIDSSSGFCWWVLSGKGGTGKSRIAYEFVDHINKNSAYYGYFAEYVDLLKLLNGSTEIDRHTLLIFDYASRFSDEIFQLIKYYSVLPNHTFKLRILLIERSIVNTWFDKFKSSIEVQSKCFQTGPMELSGLSEVHLLNIARSIELKQSIVPKYSDQKLLKIIKRVDPFMRPLFAMFVGVALSDGGNFLSWNQYDLLKYQLERENDIIKDKYKQVSTLDIHKHNNLLVLCTICSGLTEESLLQVLDNGFHWLPDRNSFNRELYIDMAGGLQIDTNLGIPPLLPDIIGEFFVLESFRATPTMPYGNPKWSYQLMNLASEKSLPMYFIRRILQDFPTHDKVTELFQSPLWNGAISRDVLLFMRHVHHENTKILESLWKICKFLKQNSRNSDGKLFMDDPNRVYQEASAIMLLNSKGSYSKQLSYYEIIEQNTNEFMENPFEFMDVQSDSFLSNMSAEEAADDLARLSRDEEYRKSYIKEHQVIWADIPFWECEAINLFFNGKSIPEVDNKEFNKFIDRLALINSLFTDPRIRLSTLQSYLTAFKFNSELLDEKINNLYYLIEETPRQVPTIDVTFFKVLFTHKVCFYYLEDRQDVETSLIYYRKIFDHVTKLVPHSSHINGMEQLAHTAANMITYNISVKNTESNKELFNCILVVTRQLGPAAPPILLQMITELGRKVNN